MNYDKLLSRQIDRYLPEQLRHDPAMTAFLSAVQASYTALERDRELAERAFAISEEEYSELHDQLAHEVDVKRQSIQQLNEAVNTIYGIEPQASSDDLLGIARLLSQQVNQRKSAEQIFTSLIANMESGVLLEDEDRTIVFTNQVFCDLFSIPATPEQLQGIDCNTTAESTQALFKEPDFFTRRIRQILEEKQLVRGEIMELANGRIYQRDYIPIFIDNTYKGHLWSYTNVSEQYTSQEAIRQSERKNRLIMNGALDAIITIDRKGLVTFWNPQAERIFGWTSEEVLGQPLTRLIIPDQHRTQHDRGMEQYATTGRGAVLNKQMELVAINRDQKSFPIELYIIPVQEGEDEFFCSFIRDISERKKSESELEKLSLVASANRNGIVFVGLDGTIFWTNEGFSQLTQYSPAECKGKTPFRLCKGPYTDRASLQIVRDAFKNGQSFDVEGIHYKKDGSWFWARTNGQPVFNKQGQLTHYFSMVEDISAEKVVQRQLMEYEERLRMALTNVGDNYWEHNFATQRTYFSNLENNLLGFPLDDATNMADLWWRQVHPDDKHILIENDRQYKAGLLRQHSHEYRMVHHDGSVHWVLDRGVLTEQDEEGKPLKIIGTHIDITRQKELELALKRAKEAAEDSTRAKELFLANMSHEIRTPMNAIMGMANQLRKTALDADQQFYLSTIQSATDNLLVIINDILDLSKIEAGHLTLEQINFEPQQVLYKAMQVLQHRAQEKGLAFTNSFCDPRLAPVLIGDPYRLTQVMLNLLSNAIKFTDTGSVDICCRVIEDDILNQRVIMTVTDTGIGMEESFAKNLFQKFSQEDESITRRYGGTGLGMSICKRLVMLMGGDVEVESQKGVGTTVYCTIPFRKGTLNYVVAKEAVRVDTHRLAGRRILVADDNEMNRMVACLILQQYGVILEEAKDGADALHKLDQQAFDLILMDVQMPVMDGLEATREIRSRYSTQLPIIALTALAIMGDEEKFMAAGMTDYLSKPFEEQQLLAVVSKWLNRPDTSPSPPTEKPDLSDEADSLVDLSRLYRIGKGDETFVNQIIELFIDQVPASLLAIKNAYLAKDFKQLIDSLDQLKPSIDNLEIRSVDDIILSIEREANQRSTSPLLETLIDTLETVLVRVIYNLLGRGLPTSRL